MMMKECRIHAVVNTSPAIANEIEILLEGLP